MRARFNGVCVSGSLANFVVALSVFGSELGNRFCVRCVLLSSQVILCARSWCSHMSFVYLL